MPRIPLAPIAVDDFTNAPGVTIFLLTHLHTDHLKGLSPSWDRGHIYGSPLTLQLLQKRMPGLDPGLLRPIEEGARTTVPLDAGGHVCVGIQTIPVVHCLGSVMFLLTGYFGHVLCTGDFRYSASEWVIKNVPELQPGVIDDVFMDDTFLDPQHEFPTQDVAEEQVKDFVRAAESERGRLDTVLVKVDLWGKEELLVALAALLDTLVVVTPERMDLLECALDRGLLPRVFTTDRAAGRIVTVSYRPRDADLEARCARTGANVVAVLPTGWVGGVPDVSLNRRVLRVGYSAHSSFSELLEFVSWIRPRAIAGIARADGNQSVRRHAGPLLRDYPDEPVTLVQRLDNGRRVPPHVLSALTRAASATPQQGGGRHRRTRRLLRHDGPRGFPAGTDRRGTGPRAAGVVRRTARRTEDAAG